MGVFLTQSKIKKLSELEDVNLDNLQNGESLCYNSTTGIWEDAPSGGTISSPPTDFHQVINIYIDPNENEIIYETTED